MVSCYEAGRDGFWLHRALAANGVESLVVDSSSIEVPQRARRKKTDRIDLVKLMALLLRYAGGERGVWSVVARAGHLQGGAMLIEIAWCWLRYQPKSALSRWFQRRFAKGNTRLRRIGIVALARKLLVALWRYLEEGLVPEGASLKAPKTRRAAA